jgi:NADH-quinone oxidoreductase subunit J
MAYFLFFLLAIICIGAVLAMIISKDQAYNALFLILAFICIGGLFALLEAPFIAVVQIIIYAGAIMVLFIFVVMMINLRKGMSPEKKKWTAYFAAVIGAALLTELLFAIRGILKPMDSSALAEIGSPTELGRLLFTKYLYPFEITSILIIAAIVGAIVLVKKRENP